jgi:photosystem II stability/assembly factor-like uncharacterized protein
MKDCVAVGDGILATTNGGATWLVRRPMPDMPDMPFTAVSCPSTKDCLVVPGLATRFVFSTSNGGSTWTKRSLPIEGSWLGGISCPSTKDCVLVGPDGLLVTTNGGSTWVARYVPLGPGVGNGLKELRVIHR